MTISSSKRLTCITIPCPVNSLLLHLHRQGTHGFLAPWVFRFSAECVNNVDVSVAANALFSFALEAVLDAEAQRSSTWLSDDFADLLNHTTKYLAWAVEQRLVLHRPDISMLYYPVSAPA